MEREQIVLQPGTLMPNFSLPCSAGQSIQLADYRQRLNLVVAFLGREDCDEFIRDLATRREDFEFGDAEVLIVIQGTARDAEQRARRYHFPFPILADETGEVHLSFGAIEHDEDCKPIVYVLDRFGEIYAVYPFAGEYKLPSADDLLSWIQFIELQCPE